jgi:hypothetical protein
MSGVWRLLEEQNRKAAENVHYRQMRQRLIEHLLSTFSSACFCVKSFLTMDNGVNYPSDSVGLLTHRFL